MEPWSRAACQRVRAAAPWSREAGRVVEQGLWSCGTGLRARAVRQGRVERGCVEQGHGVGSGLWSNAVAGEGAAAWGCVEQEGCVGQGRGAGQWI